MSLRNTLIAAGASTLVACGSGNTISEDTQNPSKVKNTIESVPADHCGCVNSANLPTTSQEIRAGITSISKSIVAIHGGNIAKEAIFNCLSQTLHSQCAGKSGSYIFQPDSDPANVLWVSEPSELNSTISNGPENPNEVTTKCNRVLLGCLTAAKQCSDEQEKQETLKNQI